jgi:mono/diheme cytochrome c family protein
MPTIRSTAAVTCAAILPLVLLAACGGGDKQPAGDTGAAAQTAAAPAAAAGGAQSGEQVYQRCMTCHQANGAGIPGTYPPLAGSEYANAANPAVPIRVVLHGLQGPVTVKGQQFNGLMPAYGTGIEMSDAEVAAVLTYVRSSFGNNAGPVTPEQVAQERAAQRTQTGAATAAELDALMKK